MNLRSCRIGRVGGANSVWNGPSGDANASGPEAKANASSISPRMDRFSISRFSVDANAGRWADALALLHDPAKPKGMAPPEVAEYELVFRRIKAAAPQNASAVTGVTAA